MKKLNQSIGLYQQLLQQSNLQSAYLDLMQYFSWLRSYFINQYKDELIVGRLYQGYLDMSYFPLTTTSLQKQQLKITLILKHAEMEFAVWLVGHNKLVQQQYWKKLKKNKTVQQQLPRSASDYVIAQPIAQQPDFNNLTGLTNQIEQGVMAFLQHVGSLEKR